MTANVGTLDRVVRLILGCVLIAAAFYHHGVWVRVGVAGPVFILTALLSFSPVYWLLRIRTVGGLTRTAL